MVSFFFHSKPNVRVSRVNVMEKCNGIMFRVKLTKSVVNILSPHMSRSFYEIEVWGLGLAGGLGAGPWPGCSAYE